jgi:hypothetical protein
MANHDKRVIPTVSTSTPSSRKIQITKLSSQLEMLNPSLSFYQDLIAIVNLTLLSQFS